MATQVASRRVALAVGIILLAVGTVAIISIVKQRGEAARHDEITKIANERLEEMESEGAPLEQDRNNGAQSSAISSDKDKPAADESRAADSSQSQDSAASSAESSDSVASASQLPQSGISDILGLLPAGVLTFALVAYIQSRRIS